MNGGSIFKLLKILKFEKNFSFTLEVNKKDRKILKICKKV